MKILTFIRRLLWFERLGPEISSKTLAIRNNVLLRQSDELSKEVVYLSKEAVYLPKARHFHDTFLDVVNNVNREVSNDKIEPKTPSQTS